MSGRGADQGRREARDRFVSSGNTVRSVRDEIRASQHRCLSSGPQRERVEVPYEPDLEAGKRLDSAARPVLDHLGDDLVDSGMSVLLTDQRAHIMGRWAAEPGLRARLDRVHLAPGFVYSEGQVGTTAIGTALEQHLPSVVEGDEHDAEPLSTMTCAAAPITDLRTGRILGVVDLTSSARDASALMLPIAKRAASDIEQRLVDNITVADRVLLEYFLRARRRARGAVLALDERTMLTNAAAARMLQASDQALLWTWASEAIAGRSPATSEFLLASGVWVRVRCEAVRDGGVAVGCLIRLDPATADEPLGGRRVRNRRDRLTFGWASLTANERGVAHFVSHGMTNREAAAHLFLSPHTIDYHLRQIFHKLGIGSRVELARLVVERSDHHERIDGPLGAPRIPRSSRYRCAQNDATEHGVPARPGNT